MAGNSYDTPPFLTLDHACRDPGLVLEALNGDWKKFIESDEELSIRLSVQGISNPSDRKEYFGMMQLYCGSQLVNSTRTGGHLL